MTRQDNRHGKHSEDQTRIHFWLSKEMKQLAQYLAATDEVTMTELAIEGITNRAMRRGLLEKDGSIKASVRAEMVALDNLLRERAQAKHKARISARLELAMNPNKENKENNK